jgi:hypothetical protein
MVEFLQDSDPEPEGESDSPATPPQHLLMLSVAATQLSVNAPKTMRIPVVVQRKELLFLIDSGSSTYFIDRHVAATLSGVQKAALPVRVKVWRGNFQLY